MSRLQRILETGLVIVDALTPYPASGDEIARSLGAVADHALRDIGAILRLAGQGTPVATDLAAGRMLGQLVLLLSGLGVAEEWAAVAAGA